MATKFETKSDITLIEKDISEILAPISGGFRGRVIK